jgi:hypothetical protein
LEEIVGLHRRVEAAGWIERAILLRDGRRARSKQSKTPGQRQAGGFQSGSLTYEAVDFNPPISPELRTKNLAPVSRFPTLVSLCGIGLGGRREKASERRNALPIEQHHTERGNRQRERENQSNNQKFAFRVRHSRVLPAANPIGTA